MPVSDDLDIVLAVAILLELIDVFNEPNASINMSVVDIKSSNELVSIGIVPDSVSVPVN